VLNFYTYRSITDILKINGAIPPPVIAFPIYMDAVSGNWNGWTVQDGAATKIIAIQAL
jgi:hypothetical protein